jgi:hypothetical protein
MAESSPEFWESRWREGQTGWDLGGPSPPARRRLRSRCAATAPTSHERRQGEELLIRALKRVED